MKKTTLLIISILVFTIAKSQDLYENDEIRTIFSREKSNGGYGAFTISYSNIGGYDALVTGGRGAFIFDRVLAVGLAGYGFVNNLEYDRFNNQIHSSLAGGYGGLLIEPILAGTSPVHLSFPVLIGAGGVTLTDFYNLDDWQSPFSNYEYDYDAFFVVEPGVELELNVTRFFRLAAAVSYRYTSEIELLGFEDVINGPVAPNALRGFNYGLTFKFGKF